MSVFVTAPIYNFTSVRCLARQAIDAQIKELSYSQTGKSRTRLPEYFRWYFFTVMLTGNDFRPPRIPPPPAPFIQVSVSAGVHDEGENFNKSHDAHLKRIKAFDN
ncbi:hypothetical protein EVAR_7144_1 [Eumeta japonica]|uniref:Uncharacterized protein n=1 Tax=Eumeta variegata TaxID=151549 RepID=A0A4C1U6I4_EUMVA|nr:hypothetical protein EVAR_7144_1 [Eumeta japonica]